MAGKVSPESRRELRKLNSALKVMAFLQGQDLTQASQVHPRPALTIFSEALPWKGHLCIQSWKANIAMKTKLPPYKGVCAKLKRVYNRDRPASFECVVILACATINPDVEHYT